MRFELCGATATLLEWDAKIPPFEEVHAEAMKARRYWQHVETKPAPGAARRTEAAHGA